MARTLAAALLALFVGCAQLHAQDTARVVMLGSGTPNAQPERSGPGVAIVVNGRAYLVDAGPGIVRRAAAAAARDHIAALTPESLTVVFVTHLHSDHTVGLPDLMLSPWTLGRAKPLTVYGPPGLKAMASHLTAAYSEDVRNRTTGLEPANHTGWRIVAHEIGAGVVYRDSNVTVRAFEVPHAGWAHAFGYRFETRTRTIVVSGDTRPTDAIVRACDGCDVLVHEVYSADKLAKRTADWRRYHHDAHTSAPELGVLATKARPKLLVLYHVLAWGATDDELLAELRRSYGGPAVVASDLSVY